jgi:hypothetical protein
MIIDIFVKKSDGSWAFQCSHSQSKTCREAKKVFLQMNPNFNKANVRAKENK